MIWSRDMPVLILVPEYLLTVQARFKLHSVMNFRSMNKTVYLKLRTTLQNVLVQLLARSADVKLHRVLPHSYSGVPRVLVVIFCTCPELETF